MDQVFVAVVAIFVLALLAGAMYNIGYSAYYVMTGEHTPYYRHKVTALLSAAFLFVGGGWHLVIVALICGAAATQVPKGITVRYRRTEPPRGKTTVRDVTPKKHREMLERW